MNVLEAARRLTILADEGEKFATDDSCRVMYCIVRDCAYKLRQMAEAEREKHRRKGDWDAASNVPA
jgi:hypothetical protein